MKAIKLLLAAAIISLSFGASAQQGHWTCTVNNAQGQAWNGMGLSRSAATQNALGLCAKSSRAAGNCAIRHCMSK